MKYIRTIFFTALLALGIYLNADCQTNGTNGHIEKQDSLKKVQAENVKLYRESFVANAALIDSTFKRLQKILAWESFEENKAAYNYFIEAMFQVWLENRKKKK